jgi:hypothetical protein
MSDRRPKQAGATVLIAVVGVVVFALLVLGLTGVLFGKGAKARREPVADTEPGEGRRWYRFEISLLDAAVPDAVVAPFMVGIGDDGKAFVVNGREELPVVVDESNSSFSLTFPEYGTRLLGTVDASGGVSGSLATMGPAGEPLTLPVTGVRLSDGLPERRFAKAPARPEARVEGADFSHVWQLSLGPEKRVAKAVFTISDSQEAFGTIRTAEGDFGALAGRQYGRILWLSTFDGISVRVIVATLDETLERLAGTVATAGGAPMEFVGERADRVALPEPLVVASSAAPGPAIELVFQLAHRPSADAVALVKAVRESTGIEVRGLLLGSNTSPERLRALGVDFAFTSVPGAVGGPVGSVDRLAALPTIIVRRADGSAEATFSGLVSRTAGGAERALQVEVAAKRVVGAGRPGTPP